MLPAYITSQLYCIRLYVANKRCLYQFFWTNTFYFCGWRKSLDSPFVLKNKKVSLYEGLFILFKGMSFQPSSSVNVAAWKMWTVPIGCPFKVLSGFIILQPWDQGHAVYEAEWRDTVEWRGSLLRLALVHIESCWLFSLRAANRRWLLCCCNTSNSLSHNTLCIVFNAVS